MSAREPIHFDEGGGTSFRREPIHFDTGGGGFTREPIHFNEAGSGGGGGGLGWGDVLPNLWHGVESSATGIPGLALQALTTPDEFAADFVKSAWEVTKGYGTLGRSFANIAMGDVHDFKKFNEQFKQKFFADPLTYSVVGLALGKGVGARAAALRQLERGRYRTATRGADLPPPKIGPRSLARAGVLGWDPRLPEGTLRDVISVELGKDIPGVGVKGTPLVSRTLPRSTYRAERMKAVDRLLKTYVPPHTWMLGEYSRAARALRRSKRTPYLALVSLPAFAEADKAHRDMTMNEKLAEGLRNTLPEPEDLQQHIANLTTRGTPEALQTVSIISDPKILELHANPSPRMQRYNELAHELDQARQQILIHAGAATPVERPIPAGHTRLYRAEGGEGPDAPIPDWMRRDPTYRASEAASGRWYAENKEGAQWYLDNERPGGTLNYVDVPTALAEAHRVSNLGGEAAQFSARPGEEFFLPEDVALQTRAVAENMYVPEFEASPYRQTQQVRGGKILTNSLANRFLRKTDASWRAAQRAKAKLVREADRFGTNDMREILRQTREAQDELIGASERRGQIVGEVSAQTPERGVAPVSVLKQFRTYDIPRGTHRELEREIAAEGIREPIEISISPDGRASITDGNHRLAIAERLGITDMPFVVKRVRSLPSTKAEMTEADFQALGIRRYQGSELGDISRAADEAYDRMEASHEDLDMVMGGEMDLRLLDRYEVELPEGHLSGRVGDSAVAQAIQNSVREAEQKEEKRITAALKRARERTSTSRELDELGLTIPSDIRAPTEKELALATEHRVYRDQLTARLREAKKFKLTEEERKRMARTIEKLNKQILKLETPRAISRSQGTLKRRFESRYAKAEKILRKDLAEVRKSIEGLGDLPAHLSPLEQKRQAIMAAVERVYRKDVKQYERLTVAEHALQASAEASAQVAERLGKLKREKGALHEAKITAIAGQRARMRELNEHQLDLLSLRNEIDAGRGTIFGGGSPKELAYEFEQAGRQQPYYRPDVMAAETKRFGRFSRAEGSIIPQRPGADIFPSRSILFRTGQLAFHPDTLGPAYFFAARHDLNVAMHKTAMSMATKVARGTRLPEGYEFLRRTRGEKIPITEKLGGLHMSAVAREFERQHDLTTTDGNDADIDHVDELGNRYRLIVPTRFANEFRAEGKKSNFFLKNFIEKPMDVWRTLLLHLRVPWLVNNILGNSFLYAIKFAGVGGLASVARFYAEDAKTDGYLPAMKRLASHKLSKDDMREVFPGQVRGTFFENQATGEVPEFLRTALAGRAPKTREFLDENRTARAVTKGVQSIPTWLPRADKRVERYYRRKATTRILRGSQEVQDAYATIRKQSGSASFREAVDKALAGDPNFRDYVETEVNQGLGDFLSLSRAERSYIRQLVPFYAWMREISRISAHLLVDNPGRVAILSMMSRAASEIQPEEIPGYMRGAVLNEKAGWIGDLASALPGGESAGLTGALALHGASPYGTVTDLARSARGLTPWGTNFDRREILGNLHPLIGAGHEAFARPEGADTRGVFADFLEEFGRSIPQVQAIWPYPSYLYPDRTRADLIRKILGDPRVRYEPEEAAYQQSQGR